MECKQPNVTTPVDFIGEALNIQVDMFSGKVWVCIDGEAVFRAKELKNITLQGTPFHEVVQAMADRDTDSVE